MRYVVYINNNIMYNGIGFLLSHFLLKIEKSEDREKSLFCTLKMMHSHCTFIQNITEEQYNIPDFFVYGRFLRL